MMLSIAIAAFLVLVALLTLLKEFSSETESRRAKRTRRLLGIVIAAIGVIVAVLQPLERESDIVELKEGQVICDLDSLNALFQYAVRSAVDDIELRRDIRELAKCIEATTILRSVIDSAQVQIGFGNYDFAIRLLGIHLPNAADDSIRGELHFMRALGMSLWRQSLDDSLKRSNMAWKAIAEYDSAIAYRYDLFSAWFNRGLLFAEFGQIESELASYDSALTLNQKSHIIWTNRGIALRELARYQEALHSFDTALMLARSDYRAWFARGNLLKALDQIEQSLQSYDSSLAYNPRFFEAWVARGDLLQSIKRPDEALASYDSAITLKPESKELSLRMARAYWDTGRYVAAYLYFTGAARRHPTNCEAHLGSTLSASALILTADDTEGMRNLALIACDSLSKYCSDSTLIAELRSEILNARHE